MTKLTSVLALLALASLLALAFASELEFSNAKLAFTKFMHKFEKFYGNDDFVEKFKHFSENLRRIQELNKQEGGSAVYGITRFADLSPEQFKNRFLMRRKSPNEVRAAIGGKRSTFLASATDLASLPDSIDWRLKGAVTPVKNQGGCGSCWAFSTVGNIEGRWFLAGNPLVAFSEQQLVDCDRLENEGCNGGLMVNAFRYVMKMGLSTEKSYPYEAFEDSCKSDIVQLKNGANITSYEVLSEDEDSLAAYLARNGPIAVALNADKLQFYHSGIIDSSHIDCDPMGLDHAVLLVGYGSENGKPYWIVKNSWGTSWGEHGYFRISRGKSTCGINLAASSAII